MQTPDLLVYLLLSDFKIYSVADMMRAQGLGEDEIESLSMIASVGLRESDGTPKPAMRVRDALRGDN